MKIFAVAAIAAFFLTVGSSHAQSVSVHNLPLPGAFEVVNEGGEVSLSSHVQVERLVNGEWRDVGTEMQLVCSDDLFQVPACITLRAGQRFRPPPWNGSTCGSQSECHAICRGNIFLPPGTFRFVVTLCAGGKSFAGPAFDMEDPDKPARRTRSTRRK